MRALRTAAIKAPKRRTRRSPLYTGASVRTMDKSRNSENVRMVGLRGITSDGADATSEPGSGDRIATREVWRPGLGARIHDYVNMAQIPMLFLLSVASMITDRVWVHATLVVYADLYFLSDTMWILFAPYIVKQPWAILVHHLVAMVLLMQPTTALLRLANLVGECRRVTTRCFEIGDLASLALAFTAITADILIVELNTLFLLLRRNIRGGWVFEVLFYASWLGIRIVWYPYILFYKVLPHPAAAWSTKVSFVVVVALQFWWTLAFLSPSYWKRQRGKFRETSLSRPAPGGVYSPTARDKFL